jgi:hypothetical protein
LGHVGLASAAAADDLSHVADPVAGTQAALDQVAADAGDQRDFVFAHRGGEQHGGGIGLLADLVDQLAHQVRVDARRLGDDHFGSADRLGALQQAVGGQVAGLDVRRLGLVSRWQACADRSVRPRGRPAETWPLRLERDLFAEGPHVAGVGQMRAAAQFAAELAHADHPHGVGILLAEQHHRAGSAGFGQRHGLPLDRLGRRDPRVGILLDRRQLLGRDGRHVGEVEAEPVVIDLRALLLGVRAEVLLQA